MHHISILFISLVFLLACQNNTPEESPMTTALSSVKEIKTQSSAELIEKKKKYAFDKPEKVVTLSNKLVEISGISMDRDQENLLAINDEKGVIYKIDKTTGKIIDEHKFHKSGDYEGIESTEEFIFVVKSNGTIYKIKKWGKKEDKTIVFKNELSTNDDIEGLGFSRSKNQLLVACKGRAKDGKINERYVMAFDLETEKMLNKPVLIIDRQEIYARLKEENDKLTSLTLKPDFSPSGIAVHPKKEDWYVLSSVGKQLAIYSSKGKLKDVILLSKKLYKQPEGICFDAKGNIYISTEGKGGKAKLFFIPKA